MRFFHRLLMAALLAAVMAPASGRAQTLQQFETSPWNGYAPAVVQCGSTLGVNANAATSDNAVQISVPSLFNAGGSYYLEKVVLSNASVSLTTATAGVFTATGGGGTALASDQALSTLTAAALNSAGSAYSMTLATGATTGALNAGTLYFRIGTAQGAAATVDARFYCRPAYGSAANPY